jgi:phage FluMu protein Com
MPIELHCNHCGKLVRAPDDAGGKHGKCPSCHQTVYIPTPPDQLDALALEPVDTEFERTKKRLAREAAEMAARVLRDREGLGPEKPGDRAERVAAAERAAASSAAAAAAAPRPTATASQVNEWIIRYAVSVAQGDLAQAERLETEIRANMKLAEDAIQRMLVDELPPVALAKIPRPVLVGIFKKLREVK